MAYFGLGDRETMEKAKQIKQSLIAARAAKTAPASLTPAIVPPPAPPVEASNTPLIVGGLVAAAAAAFFFLKRKKG